MTGHLPKPLPASLFVLCWLLDIFIQRCLQMCLECRTQFSLTSVGDSHHEIDTDIGIQASHSCAVLDVESFQGKEVTHLYSLAL